jgi:antitoxin HicB
MKRKIDYPVEIRPLSEDDGGGYIAIVPDLPGCMSDGETMDEALHEVVDAIESWLSVAKEFGDPIPVPDGIAIDHVPRELIPRIPARLHAKLSIKAKQDGVSLDTLILNKLSEAV